jgi:signal transduction histidine kinase
MLQLRLGGLIETLISHAPASPQVTSELSPQLFEQLFEQLSIPIALVDQQLTLHTVNQEFLKLFQENKNTLLNNFSLLQLLHENDQQRLAKHHQQYLMGIIDALPFDYHICCQRTNGSTFESDLLMDMIPDRRFVIFSFIHPRKSRQLENENHWLQKARLFSIEKLFESLAHEIKNPLHSMVINMEVLRGRLHKYAADHFNEMEKYLDALSTEVVRLDNVIRRLMDFTQPLSNQFKSLVIDSIVKNVLELLYPQIRKQNIQVIVKLQLDAQQILGDEVQIQQIFLNLLINSIEAMPNGGKLIIKSRRLRSGIAQFSIADSGAGVKKEDFRKIFNLYSSTKSPGSGLGLPVVLRMIDHHQGHFRFRTTPGKGTYCSVQFMKAPQS